MQDEFFDRLVSDKIKQHQPVVPDGLWSKIEGRLADQPEQKGGTGKHVSTRAWLSLAATIALAFGFGIYFIKPNSNEVIYLKGKPIVHNVMVPPEVTKLQDIEPVTHQLQSRSDATVANVLKPRASTIPSYYLDNPPVESRRSGNEVKPEVDQALVVGDSEPELVATLIAPSLPEKVETTIDLPNYSIDNGEVLAGDIVLDEPIRIKPKKRFTVSKLLNNLVAAVDKGDKKVIEFKDDGEGSIFFAVNFKAVKDKL